MTGIALPTLQVADPGVQREVLKTLVDNPDFSDLMHAITEKVSGSILPSSTQHGTVPSRHKP